MGSKKREQQKDRMAKIKRLVTFGCSLTYGQGLTDCWNPQTKREGPQPSVQAWPFLVARHLRVGLANESQAGASNKEIFHKLQNYDWQKGDCCIVLWTYLNRTCVIYPDFIDRYGPWVASTRSKAWLKNVFNDYDANIDLLNYVTHTELFLKTKKIKVCSYFADHFMPIEQPEQKMFKNPYIDFARDDLHPGRMHHIDFANQVMADSTGPAVWST
jgi:hypothetical protein